MPAENGVYIPIIIDVEKGFNDAASLVASGMKKLESEMSKHALSLKFNVEGLEGKKSLKTIIEDSTLSAQQLEGVIAQIQTRMNNLAQKGAFEPATGAMSDELKTLVAAFNAVVQKARGVGLIMSEIGDAAKRASEENATAAAEVAEYWADLDSRLNVVGDDIQSISIRLKASMEKLRHTPMKLADGSDNPEFKALLANIKEMEKAIIQYQTVLSSGTEKERSRLEVLQNTEQTMRVLSQQISSWRSILENSEVGGDDFLEAAMSIQELTEQLALANDEFMRMSTESGSIKRISGEMASLNRQWAQMSQRAKFDDSGNMTAQAEAMVNQFESLTALSEKYGQSLAEIAKKRAELKQHQEDLYGVETSLDNLRAKLNAWTKELNSAEIDSPEYQTAAQHVTELSQKIADLGDEMKKLGLKAGSIDEINSRVQSLNKEWAALPQRFDSLGKMTPCAKMIYQEFKKVTMELREQGKSMSEILNKEEQRHAKAKQLWAQHQKESKILASDAKTIEQLNAKIRLLTEQLNGAEIGTKRFQKLKQEIAELNQKLKEATDNVDQINEVGTRTNSLLGNLLRKTAYLFSIHTIARFLQNVREVTAEFELQKVALGSIIQDTETANTLFKQIKAAAIESPFEIKDLVSYTKQLSAFQIETDKLFDTTMRLADVSAGLGVDMGRLILAFGQVRAAAVLRGQELRQFTEAGVPLVDKLAEKFSLLYNRGVSTAEVFQLISKRAVSFKMVEEIFNDMTSAGGIFYDMQRKQAKTLAGQWANLKDAVSIMYDEIGNTGMVHNAMESLISWARNLMRNWRYVRDILVSVGVAFGTMKLSTLFLPILTRDVQLLRKAELAEARAKVMENAAHQQGNRVMGMSANMLKRYAKYIRLASKAQTAFGRGWYKLAASMVGGGWITAATIALSALIGYLIQAREESQRLGKELAENVIRGGKEEEKAVRNFEYLAKKAVEAADGSKAQRDAIDELRRTYGDIIPIQDLEIEKLRALKGEYDSLTDAISAKIQMRIHEQNIDNITDTYTTKFAEFRSGLEEFLEGYGMTVEESTRIIKGIEDAVNAGLLEFDRESEEMKQTLANIIEDATGVDSGWARTLGIRLASTTKYWLSTSTYLENFIKSTKQMNVELDKENRRFEELNNSMGRYKESFNQLQKEAAKTPEPFSVKDVNTFEYDEAGWKQRVEVYKNGIIKAFADAKIAIKAELQKQGKEIPKDFDEAFDVSSAFSTPDYIDFQPILDRLTKDLPSGMKGYIEAIQKEYIKYAPQDDARRMVIQKVKEFADEVGIGMSRVSQYIKQDETEMTDYAKEIQKAVETEEYALTRLLQLREEWTEDSDYPIPTGLQIEEQEKIVQFLKKLLEFVSVYLKGKNGGGYQQDPWILIYKNRLKFVQDFSKGVEDLNTVMTKNNAIAKEREIMEGRGLNLGFNGKDELDVRKMTGSREEVMKWYDDTIKKIQAKIAELGGRNWAGLGVQAILAKDTKNRTLKAWQDLLADVFKQQTDYDLSEQKRQIEKAIDKLKEEIKRSDAAHNFFEDIFSTTGNRDLATNMTISVYGDVGSEFADRIKRSIEGALEKAKVDETLKNDLLQAAETLDFTKVMANFEAIPKELQGVVKDAANAVEQYNIGLLKNFATLSVKYGETASKMATVSAKIQKQIDDVTAARDKMLQNKKLTPEQKQAINERADEVIKALKGEEALELKKLSDDYTKFFAEINVMTAEQTVLVRKDLREAYLKAFTDGAISADELYKNLRAIDTQFKKLNSNRNLLEAYLSGGIDKANEKLLDYADTITVISQKMKGGKTLDSGEIDFVSRMLKRFGGDETRGAKNYEELIAAFSGEGEGLQAAGEAFGSMGEGMSAMAANGPGALAIVDAIIKAVHGTIQGIQQIIDQLNEVRSEENKIGEGFKYLSDFDKYTFSGWEKLKSGDAIGATADAISSYISIFNNIQKDKVEDINDSIEEQSELLERLEYSYSRLGSAIEKAFGSDYIQHFNGQLAVLEAQADAYREQARLEREKGKSADEKVAKDYERQAREVEDKIKDSQSQLAEFFAGTDVTSAATDFANAWIEAYKEFGSTSDALSEKFEDMIQNMVVNSMAAKIVQDNLKDVFKLIDDLAKEGGELSVADAAIIANRTKEVTGSLNSSLTNLMTALGGVGLNLRSMGTGLTGIARDIQGASEESILGLAAGVNTQNYYMQHIDMNVAMILAALTGTAPVSGAPAASVADPYRDQMLAYVSSLPQMRDDMASIRVMLERVIRPNGSPATHYVAAKM